MTGALGIWLTGVALGVVFSAPPGAVTAESVRRGLAGGFWAAVSVGLGSVIGDVVYAALAFGGLALLVANPVAHTLVGLGGALWLLYLAWTGFQARDALPTAASRAGRADRAALLSGMLISLTNPWAIAFWLSIGGAMLSAGLAAPTPADVTLFFAAFVAGTVLWVLVLSALIAFGRRLLGPPLFRLVSIGSSVALGVCAVAAGLGAIGAWVGGS